MYCPDASLLFIHVPRTGGTSVEVALQEYAVDRVVRETTPLGTLTGTTLIYNGALTKHIGMARARRVYRLSKKELKRTTVVAVSRNPWDWLVSSWQYMQQHWKLSPHGGVMFSDWIRSGFPRSKFRPLPTYTTSSQGMHIDRFLKFENLEEGLNRLLLDTGLPAVRLPRMNASARRGHYSEMYNSEDEQWVADNYAGYCARHNYSFERAA